MPTEEGENPDAIVESSRYMQRWDALETRASKNYEGLGRWFVSRTNGRAICYPAYILGEKKNDRCCGQFCLFLMQNKRAGMG